MRFQALDSIRGLAAVAVVLFHLKFSFPGYLAVDLFFILSGFVLSYRYFGQPDTMKPSIADFAAARFSRLYPLHLFALMAILLIYAGSQQFPSFGDGYLFTFLQHLLLLHNTGLSTHWLSWNEPSWSISVEFWVNLLVFAYIAKKANTLGLVSLAILGYVILAANIKHLDVHIQLLFGFLNTGLVRCFAGFFIGMAVYRFYQKMQALPAIKQKSTLAYLSFSLLEVILLAACFYIMFISPIRTKADFNGPIIFTFTVLVFAFQAGMVSQIFIRLKLALLGTLSYSLYLNHFWLLALMHRLDLPTYGLTVNTLSWVFGLLLPLSAATYLLIEKPGQKWLRSRYKALKQASFSGQSHITENQTKVNTRELVDKQQ